VTMFRAHGVLTPGGLLRDGTVVVEGDRITEVRPARVGDPAALDGWILPGLINAHLHLELSKGGLVPGGGGFMAWGRRLMTSGSRVGADAERQAAQAMVEAGTAGVFDISNGGHTHAPLAAAGLRGVVQHELLGWSNRPGLAERIERAGEPVKAGPVSVRPGPHAVYSTPPALMQAACAGRGGVPASLHLAEDPGELELVRDRSGPFYDWLIGMGIPAAELSAFGGGGSLLDYLDGLGVLGPELFLVHGVYLDAGELGRLAERAVHLCLCPRSNLHISGDLPDVVAMIRAGVPLCLGTDSLASSPDLDVLGEVQLLTDAFPSVEPITWLQAATSGASRAIGRPDLGRLEVGRAPGLLLLEGLHHPQELTSRPATRWLRAPAGSP
jgi:aminodeoxyfutalosine deaminase